MTSGRLPRLIFLVLDLATGEELHRTDRMSEALRECRERGGAYVQHLFEGGR